MSTRSTIAHEFRLSLEAGVIDRGEIIQWAEGIIATEAYDDRIAEICMATHKTNKVLDSLLSAVAGYGTCAFSQKDGSCTRSWDGTCA